MDAHWIWTSDGSGHDDIYCRLIKTHEPINCRPAADRYWSDYGDVQVFKTRNCVSKNTQNEGIEYQNYTKTRELCILKMMKLR